MDSKTDLFCVDPVIGAALAELDAAVTKMRQASRASLHTSESFTRTVRSAKPSRSDPAMRAVRADSAPEDDSDITSTFKALRHAT